VQLLGIARLGKPEQEQHTRLLRMEFHRGQRAEFIVVELDVAIGDAVTLATNKRAVDAPEGVRRTGNAK
jgi:hypothetical protein